MRPFGSATSDAGIVLAVPNRSDQESDATNKKSPCRVNPGGDFKGISNRSAHYFAGSLFAPS
jgi:hypothetical protein